MARSRTRLVIAVGAVVLLAVSVGSMMLAKPLHAKLSTDVYAKFHSDTPISKQSVEGGTRAAALESVARKNAKVLAEVANVAVDPAPKEGAADDTYQPYDDGRDGGDGGKGAAAKEGAKPAAGAAQPDSAAPAAADGAAAAGAKADAAKADAATADAAKGDGATPDAATADAADAGKAAATDKAASGVPSDVGGTAAAASTAQPEAAAAAATDSAPVPKEAVSEAAVPAASAVHEKADETDAAQANYEGDGQAASSNADTAPKAAAAVSTAAKPQAAGDGKPEDDAAPASATANAAGDDAAAKEATSSGAVGAAAAGSTTADNSAARTAGKAAAADAKPYSVKLKNGTSLSGKTLYQLSKESMQGLADSEGYLMVTWSNHHYVDFVRTWVKHVTGVGVSGYVVGAMDEATLADLVSEGINTFSMNSGLVTGDFGWGSQQFAKMGRSKIKLIAMFLELGVQVVIADVDVIWVRNPIPFFQKYPDVDVLTSSDHLRETVKDERLEKWPDAGSAFNIGMMLFRAKSLKFVKEWIGVIDKDLTIWDQNAFNDLIRRGSKPLPDSANNYFEGDNGALKVGVLPVSLFASGHTFYVQRLAERLGMQPYGVHATFQYSGTPGKRHRMRESMFFADPPSYYDHPKGFIAFDFAIPDAMLNASTPRTKDYTIGNAAGHFELVHHQLRQLRHAFALATVTGRALVIPQLWCGLDRWWAPHTGVIPGSSFPLPFPCPLDHVIDLEGGLARQQPLPPAEFGPHIDFRESSFLHNPALSAQVNGSRLTVRLCAAGGARAAGCADGSAAAKVQANVVKVKAGLDSEKWAKALSGLEGHKILWFEAMDGAFGGFKDNGAQHKFDRRMAMYASLWCCGHSSPGHVWYDLLWDVPGHTDRHNRKWPGEWTAKFGP